MRRVESGFWAHRDINAEDPHLQYLRVDGYRPMAGDLSMDGYFITDVSNPVNPQDAATKAYVDGYIHANNEWSEVLANGNTSGGTDPVISTGDEILGETDLNMRAASTGSGPASSVSLSAGDSATVFGGAYLNLIGGDSTGTARADGYLVAGDTPGSPGGWLILQGGVATSGFAGGTVQIDAGDSTSGIGGDVNVTAGSNGTGGGSGGSISLTAGSSAGGGGGTTGGDISLTAGGGTGVPGGKAAIIAGAGTNADGGDLELTAGPATGGGSDGGHVKIDGGSAALALGGNVEITSGAGGSTGNGDVLISTPSNSNGGSSGDIELSIGSATAGGGPGYIRLSTPNITAAQGGLVDGYGVWGIALETGYNTAGSDAHGIKLQPGDASGSSASGGEILLLAGSNTGTGGGGGITLQGGDAVTGSPGDVNITAGYQASAAPTAADVNITGGAHGTNSGGAVNITGGAAGSSQGGQVNLTGGNNAAGAGGNITIAGGVGTTGGHITLNAGDASGGAPTNDGQIIIQRSSVEVARWNANNQLDVAANRIIDVQDPINPQDAATKNYVDGYIHANNEWSEVLANGNTSEGTDVIINGGSNLQIGTGTVATEGDIRADDGFSLQVRNASSNVQAIGVSSGVVTVGEDSDAQGVDIRVGSGADIQAFVNTGAVLTLDGSTVDVHTQRIENVVDPVNAQDAATKNYVDGYFFSEFSSHATRHENGGDDEIEVSNMGTSETNTSYVLQPDGTGGVTWGTGGGLTAPTGAQDGYVAIASGGDLTYVAGTADGYVLTWNESGQTWESSSPGRLIMVEFVLSEEVNNTTQYFFTWSSDTTGGIRSSSNNGMQNANSCSPFQVPFNAKITKAILTVKGVGVQNGSVSYPVTYQTDLQLVGFSSESKLADVDFSIPSGFTIGTYSVGTTDYKGSISLDINVSEGDMLGLRWINGNGASVAGQTKMAFVTFVLEER